jgi:dynein heavy chain
VEISRNYGLNEWREDLKRFCRIAGADNKPCVFLFSETQVGQGCRKVAVAADWAMNPAGFVHTAPATIDWLQIKSESFVEDLNNLLNSGEVPNMFPYDERTAVCEAVSTTGDGAAS